MAKRAAAQRRVRRAAARERTQCHVVSNTHWDREWKNSAQRNRHRLVDMLDRLLEIFARYPDYRHFHLDSQTVPLLDYLEIRPEREDELRRLVAAGRLAIGPWFTLPDEFCVAGEALIRNLLLGHRIARRFGGVSKTGYSPFSWGQISQMPQIYRGFGIDVMLFYRGVNTHVAPRAEFIWRAPDGSEILASRLGWRPRYNAWYVLQRPAYWGARLDALNDFEHPWSAGDAPFRMVDPLNGEMVYEFAHPSYRYHAAFLPQAAAQALREQDGDWSTPHRLWSIGHDSSFPDPRELRLIADSAAAIQDRADVFHSTIAEFEHGLRDSRRPDWPVVTGEMRHVHTKGSSSWLLGWILSARTYLKQDNFRTERLLINLAEPLAAFARLLGAEYPRPFLDEAWRWLLLNHPHDSIGGCGRDVVHDDMLYRARQARETGSAVLQMAAREIAGAIDTSAWDAADVALVVLNVSPQPRSAPLRIALDVPAEWPSRDLDILDAQDHPLTVQPLYDEPNFSETIECPNDVLRFVNTHRRHLLVDCRELPAFGYRTYRVRPHAQRRFRQPATLQTGPQTMENEHLAVTINANGTLDVLHKATGHTYPGLGYFRDSGASGNPWQHQPPPRDALLTTLNERARVSLVHDGALECAFAVALDWKLPESLTADRQARSPHLVPFVITNTVTLRRGEPWVEVVTTFENVARDHYLRVSFPTHLAAANVDVQSPFDVVARPCATPDYSQFDDDPQPEQPMDSFVDVSDGKVGLALLNEGLKAYEAHDDPPRTISLTLLRALTLQFFVPERSDFPDLAAGAQCPGRQQFRYAILPHAGGWETADVWAAAERFNTPLLAAQIGPSRHGTQPRTRTFLDVRPEGLHVSAIKRSESGEGWIVRLFNPGTRAARGRIRLNAGYSGPPPIESPLERVEREFALPAGRGRKWKRVRQVTLDEVPERTLKASAEGWVAVQVPAKRIVTVEFLA